MKYSDNISAISLKIICRKPPKTYRMDIITIVLYDAKILY